MKNSCIFKQAVRRVTLLYISANFFNACLYRRQLDSYIWFYIQSIPILYVMCPLENSTVHF